jgi:LysR family nitrogen assimilation transcriptional regulator
MNLRTLKYFVAIADAGSFTAAATAVAIAQPALTRQLRDLEADLGVQLLQRSARGVRLTQAGAIFYESAKRMLSEATRVRRQLGSEGEAFEKTVVLGVTPTLTRVLLPGVFQRCHHSLTGVRLVIVEAFTPQLMHGLERGHVDIAVVTNPEPHRALTLQPLLTEPFALISPVGHGVPPIVPLSMLARTALLVTKFHLGIVERALAPLSVKLGAATVLDSVDAIRELVRKGAWATVMPVSVFKEPDIDTARMSEISGAQINRMLVLATRIERAQSSAIAVVGELIQLEAAALVEQGMFSFGGGSWNAGAGGR